MSLKKGPDAEPDKSSEVVSASGAESNSASSVAADSNEPNDWQTYKRLLGYVKPHWFVFLVATVFFLVASSAEGYFAFIFGDLVESFQQMGDSDHSFDDSLYRIPLMIFGLAVARAIGEVIGEILLSRISFSVVHALRTELFEQLLDLPSSYFDNSSQGHLVSRITFNVAQMRDTGTEALRSLVQDGGKVIVFFTGMLLISWKLTLIFVAIAPVVGAIVAVASKRFRRISRRIQNSMGDVTHVASELVSGYRVIRTFGGEPYERDRFTSASLTNTRQNLKMVLTKASSTQIIQVLIAAALALLIALLYNPSIAGEMSAGDVVTFLGLAGLLARPIKKLTEINARLQRGLAAAEDVFAQFDEERESDEGTLSTDRVTGHVSFRNVGFGYEGSKTTVLEGIDFDVEPGQTVALVGRSGSGKSTLVSLIPRFYEPTSGEILLDGEVLSSYQMAALRRQIALVTQQVTLFNDTLERNIAYGMLEGTEPEKLDDAVRRSHVAAFLADLPDGLQTLLGDNGVLLSGGQRQRVAIARALLKDAPILILDEATSALDTASERHIQEALDEVMKGRTTFVIAHRLSTIENADRIMVLDQGSIVESGSHEELLLLDGHYAALHKAQFSKPSKGKRKKASRSSRLLGQLSGKAHEGAASSTTPTSSNASVASTGSNGRLARAWYSGAFWPKLLWPLGKIVERVAMSRRQRYLTGKSEVWRAPVPVIVVGNITAGGTGKTPFVIFLVHWLRSRGFNPGVVSRGYGGNADSYPLSVTGSSSPAEAGDEAPLIASRTAAPVVVDPDRVAAAKALLESHQCDVIVSDDGLQHYALGRDVEIVMLDGERGLGNGLPIPAGPMREPRARLESVDMLVALGGEPTDVDDCHVASVTACAFTHLVTREEIAPEDFVERYPRVQAVAGIGNPSRFLTTLTELGLVAGLRQFPDHHDFVASDLHVPSGDVIVMTEKDATKVRALLDSGQLPRDRAYFALQVELTVPASLEQQLETVLESHGVTVGARA